MPLVVAMVHELAEYERAPRDCQLRADQLRAALFADRPALFGHVARTADGAVAGFALWFHNFSTWRGTHGIYVEDLYVRPAARGTGLGKALLAELAGICVDGGYDRLEWSVLDWNRPALDFYLALGATAMDGWTVHRLSGTGLAALALGTPAGDVAAGVPHEPGPAS